MLGDTREAAMLLADDILKNIELNDIALATVMLKCARLARLLGDENKRQVFGYEAGGYPTTTEGIPPEVFELGRLAGRVYEDKGKDGSIVERMNSNSIASIEAMIEADKIALASARDRDISLSSANPSQFLSTPIGNMAERNRLLAQIYKWSTIISASRTFAYEYASSVQYELEFSEVASSIFDRVSARVDSLLISIVPKSANKMASINENLKSENPEDWANAVHGCRRLLQTIADALFAPTDDKEIDGKLIKLGSDNYINRLIAFIELNSKSGRFVDIVGSNLSYIGNRLDALFKAAQKGSHAEITSRGEAERYVIYTYMMVGDILTLKLAE